uniref:dTDP-4-dehydrorhamnose 3,5-epimerase n=1 Tax=Algoriphagus sp. TaxID=1872435 RepID=UPI004048346D
MKIIETPMEGLLVVEPRVFSDDRGFFLETYQRDRYVEAGITDNFVQDNLSRSKKGVLRGLHFQVNRPQSQLVSVVRGSVFDVVVDVRPASVTFGHWYGIELSDLNARQLYMAPGFAHGFCVLSDWADFKYKVDRKYDHGDEGGLVWNDPDVNIKWPVKDLQIIARDAAFPMLKNIPKKELPQNPPLEKTDVK